MVVELEAARTEKRRRRGGERQNRQRFASLPERSWVVTWEVPALVHGSVSL